MKTHMHSRRFVGCALAALLGMLNTCAANVTAVNIDNGFGAGYVAALINRTAGEPAEQERTDSCP